MEFYLSLIFFLIFVLFINIGQSQFLGLGDGPNNIKCNNSMYIRPCYFTNWAIYRNGRAKFTPEDYAPGLCTHIFYAFAYFNESFDAYAIDPNDLPNGSDPDNMLKYDPNLKLVLSFGGWTFSTNTTLFERMMSSKENRSKFIKSAIAFVRKHGFDGIDIDCEYPKSKLNFNLFLQVVAANIWYRLGMPRCKIVIGFPTYGHGWKLTNPNSNDKRVGAQASGPANATQFVQSPGDAAYFEICEMLANGAKSVYDESAQVPYLYQNDEWFSYDDVQSYKKKLKWLKTQAFGGAFVWALDFDDFNGKCPGNNDGIYPLIGTIAKLLGDVKGPLVSVSDIIKGSTSAPKQKRGKKQKKNKN
ncbi:Glyco_18 domain-containing protein [Meloidogyne graminicola]|uniref:Glyco_18 domain-containing protein n=1 Tax=Meloidogyne graminicola TaxID=189291 RepID=A0A8S9ZHX2_9BILA|nr:Glyco_18 domain-containing protein [Meloidogyne graminicola]